MRGSLLARRGWAGTAPDKERSLEKPRFNRVLFGDGGFKYPLLEIHGNTILRIMIRTKPLMNIFKQVNESIRSF